MIFPNSSIGKTNSDHQIIFCCREVNESTWQRQTKKLYITTAVQLYINKYLESKKRKKTILQQKSATMNRFLLATLTFLIPFWAFSQNYSGQWKGSFDETRDPSRTEYVLEIEANGNTFEGISITYFSINGKRCYTMCAIKGTIDQRSKTLTSTEIYKIKANTPDWFLDCFQTHILTYYKKGNEEQLIGTWKSARPTDNCGTGSTLLSRTIIPPNNTKNDPNGGNKNQTGGNNQTKNKTENPTNNKKENESTTNNKKEETGNKNKTTSTTGTDKKQDQAQNKTETKTTPQPKLEKRENKVFETITLESELTEVFLYDNGQIDGDIITLIFNGEVILNKQTLSDKPIIAKIKLIPGKDNVLTMYAENLGEIPPNTATMRIKNQDQYHTVFLSADDKQNGSVILKMK
jgi:hypothetical protein